MHLWLFILVFLQKTGYCDFFSRLPISRYPSEIFRLPPRKTFLESIRSLIQVLTFYLAPTKNSEKISPVNTPKSVASDVSSNLPVGTGRMESNWKVHGHNPQWPVQESWIPLFWMYRIPVWKNSITYFSQ